MPLAFTQEDFLVLCCFDTAPFLAALGLDLGVN